MVILLGIALFNMSVDIVIHRFNKVTVPLFKILSKTSSGVWSLKGGIPVRNSKKQIPRDHQSTPVPEILDQVSFLINFN